MARKPRPYFICLEQAPGGPWTPQFGDYSRECVQDEMRDMKAASKVLKDKCRYRILATATDTQAAINSAIAELNAKG